MEDLLEEIFGDIRDEYDTEEFEEKKISDDEYILSGRLELDHLREKYGLQFLQKMILKLYQALSSTSMRPFQN